ncbi:helix-turn-helix domain-containing protein [Paenibacillus apiarius]|uniref:helix-turn-helix domain-containing protein n=1 Tax=Paenibacillus apiarius TaxID=46240 RepID=UPI00197D8573|nr:helix-turn-helix domain-containing protein [Paenibacillus apiarius]MBN3523382.1 helix-turn-helix domain-containing protein [Paenibacillus apiarius]
MAKRWFYRLLLSYMPVFIIVVSFLFFVFFQTLSEQSRKDAIQSNSSLLLQALRATDASLKDIDQMVVSEVLNAPELEQYFHGKKNDDVALHMRIKKLMKRISARNLLIDNVYLVRLQDESVLSSSGAFTIREYMDKDFIEAHRHIRSNEYAWGDVRPFKEYDFQDEKSVVSLVRHVPLTGGGDGMIVVSVATASIQALVQEWHASDLNAVSIRDRSGVNLLENDTDNLNSDSNPNSNSNSNSSPSYTVVSDYMSPYTGWTFESGFQKGKGFFRIEEWFNVWMIGGMLLLLAAMGWMVYITHRHYKPVANLVQRVNSIAETTSYLQSDQSRWDEFAVIESALDRMFAERDESAERGKQDAVFLRNYAFRQWLDGSYEEHPLNKENALDVPLDAERWCVVVAVEIDRYLSFTKAYSRRDRFLLQYAMKSAFHEIAAEYEWKVWADWLTGERLVMLWQPASAQTEYPHAARKVADVMEEMLPWIQNYLKWTSTASVSDVAASIQDIPQAFAQALRALSRKLTCGMNRVLIEKEHQTVDVDVAPLTRALALSVAQGKGEWKARLLDWLHMLGAARCCRQEVVRACTLLGVELNKRLKLTQRTSDAPPDTAKWLERIEGCETMQELEQLLSELLKQAEQWMSAAEAERSTALIRQIQAYIEANYAHPQLSLDHLSERFQVPPKTLSKSFKEVTGEKFIDFLIHIRLERAKRLLRDSDDSIQTIAEQVGYGGAVSFSRIFKKVEGVAPGEYRAVMSAQPSPLTRDG